MPRLHAAGLVLREFEVGDAALIQEASADPVIPLITTVPTVDTVADALAFIERQHDRARSDVGYSFCIAMAATNEPIGQIGLWPESRDPGRASVGYWVIERWRGRGLAAVALAALTEWGFTLPGIVRLELYVEPWNIASWHTAEQVGYEREGLLRQWQTVGTTRRDMYMFSRIDPATARATES